MDVDWDLAARIARTACGDATSAPAPPPGLDATADVARAHVVAATRLEPSAPLPAVEWVDRATWIDANLRTMRSILDPVMARTGSLPGPLAAAGGAVVAAEVGGLLGLFARRVLGQYELDLLDPSVAPRLLLVAPNLERAAGDLVADRAEVVTWVTLHEVTHAVQFGAVPWLRTELGGALRGMIDTIDGAGGWEFDSRALLRLGLDDVRAMVDRVRQGGLLGTVMGAERRATLDRVQGTMGLVEGHAEWAMDRAGADVLPDVDALRSAMDRRREDRAPLLRILDRLLGFDLKLRQYTQGRTFCDAVVGARGEAGLRAVWDAADRAPTVAELADPSAWLARTA